MPTSDTLLEAPTKVSNKQLALGLTRASYAPSLRSMGAAIPDGTFLPLEQIDRAYRKVLRDKRVSHDTYETPGVAGLRQQVALYTQKIGFAADPEKIIITSGCQEATLMSLKAITKPGDTVAIETPTYLAAERWDIKALLISPNFSNPSGSLMSDGKKQRLVKFCSQNDIYIIEDDIYGDLSFDQYYRPKPLKAFDTDDTVMVGQSTQNCFKIFNMLNMFLV